MSVLVALSSLIPSFLRYIQSQEFSLVPYGKMSQTRKQDQHDTLDNRNTQ